MARDKRFAAGKTLTQGEFVSPGHFNHRKVESNEKTTTFVVVFSYGGPEGIRTLDLSDANRTLSQLSYEPEDHSADLFSQSIIPQFFLFVKPYF